MVEQLVLVKHAQPVLDAAVPAREWRLAQEGERQAQDLAASLRGFLPFTLVSSHEPKAVATAGIVGRALSLPVRVVAGLEEFDRPALPILPADEHVRLNARIFESPAEPVLGRESALGALQRFASAVESAISEADQPTLVAITHGTVISLLVAAHNPVPPLDFWQRLTCGSFVVLAVPGFRLLAVGTPEDGAGFT